MSDIYSVLGLTRPDWDRRSPPVQPRPLATFVGASFIFRQSEYIARIPPAHPNIGAYVQERNISVGICAAFTRQLTIEMLDMGIPPDRALLNMKMRDNSYFGQLARTQLGIENMQFDLPHPPGATARERAAITKDVLLTREKEALLAMSNGRYTVEGTNQESVLGPGFPSSSSTQLLNSIRAYNGNSLIFRLSIKVENGLSHSILITKQTDRVERMTYRMEIITVERWNLFDPNYGLMGTTLDDNRLETMIESVWQHYEVQVARLYRVVRT
jgi:hypothetical protein